MKREVIYLDHAATSWPKPAPVLEAMTRFLATQAGSPNRAGHRLAVAADRVVHGVRVKLARLLGVDEPNRIIHCFNCTDALNMALKGSLRPGDHVISTQLDHNSVARPLQAMVDAGMITWSRIPVTDAGYIVPELVQRAFTPATRLIVLVHASNVTGTIQPVEEIGRLARQREVLLLVDAAQSVGVVDIDMEKMDVDLLAFPGHKSLQGPTGTGALCVGHRVRLKPWREGGTGADSATPTQPTDFPTWLEAGTHNAVGLAGLSAALDELDPAHTLSHERSLIQHFVDAIADDKRIRLAGPWSPARCVGVTSVVIRGVLPQEAAANLDESAGIAVRPGLHCAPFIHRRLGTFPDGTVRVSPGPTTTVAEIDRLIAALRSLPTA